MTIINLNVSSKSNLSGNPSVVILANKASLKGGDCGCGSCGCGGGGN
ncbi:MAG: hypothetical protein Q8928_12570 [Bacteroidota bacterium]|nr:hypothetical protein [Bacteroidota bacterium]